MCRTRSFIVCAMVAVIWGAFAQSAVAQPQVAYLKVDGDNGLGGGDGSGWGERIQEFGTVTYFKIRDSHLFQSRITRAH